MNALDVENFEVLSKNTLILDTRQPDVFILEFIPRSINIGLGDHFMEWVQRLLPKETPLSIVADEQDVADTYSVLDGLGYKNIMGHLSGGIQAWRNADKAFDLIVDVTEEEAALDFKFDKKILLVDVREPVAFENSHVENAENFPLHAIVDPLQIAQLDEDSNIYVYCEEGYKSAIACSIMKKEGFQNIRNILGGFQALKSNPNIKIISGK
ncbi:MAG TPA: rhodanese-like domain-containing protein [Edaphocola sp.]|nr:rhodanese-like domain-containing protein [Edaphocola sp.]